MTSVARLGVLALVALAVVAGAATPARAADLCGRPGGKATEVFERLTKVEQLPEVFRDKSYVALSDQPRTITWTFTVAGHAAHPTVVCRRIVPDGSGNLNLEMQISCDAVEAACLQLKRDFEALNARMIEEMKKQRR